MAFAGALFGIDVEVFMVRVSYQQKPYRRALMETWGATCTASPSDRTAAGRAILAERPDPPGRLGIAISEAVEVAVQREDTNYALRAVLNHMLAYQTVVGLEAIAQLELASHGVSALPARCLPQEPRLSGPRAFTFAKRCEPACTDCWYTNARHPIVHVPKGRPRSRRRHVCPVGSSLR